MGFQDRPYYGDERGGSGGGFGGRLGGLLMPNWPSVTAWLIIANVAVFFIDGFLGRIQHGPGGAPGFLTEWGQFSFTDGVARFQIWRFVSYQFLHMGGWHLFGNMLTLFFFGSMVENHLGARRFLGYYLLCGVAGAIMYLLLFGIGWGVGDAAAERIPFLLIASPDTPMVGASAAVFGVLIGAWRIAPHMTVMLFFVLPVPLRLLIMLILLVEVYTVMVGGFNAGGSAAHLGGVVAGIFLIARPKYLAWFDRVNAERFSPGRLRADAKRRSFERRNKKEQAMDAEVDRILEKVHRDGIHSLSAKEKRTLQQATEKQRGG